MSTGYATHEDTAMSTEAPAIETPAEELRATSAAVKLAFTWYGTRKALDNGQRQQIGQYFDADSAYIGAAKKTIDTKHFAYRAVTKIKGEIIDYWKAHTLPFPEEGIRLIRAERVARFNDDMEGFRDRLNDAVITLDNHLGQLKYEARERLGRLYNPSDYPATLQGMFGFAWTFLNVEPPDYLLELRPGIYEQERRRVAAQFDEAVKLAEQAFAEELAALVEHLCERLTRDEQTGEAKVFRDSAVGNLREFFERFKDLNIHSNPELDELVSRAQEAIGGTRAKKLRTDSYVRDNVRAKLEGVKEALAGMTTAKPRRKIQRNAQAQAQAPEAPAAPTGPVTPEQDEAL